MLLKETNGRVEVMRPLVSWVAVLMGRPFNRKESRMNTGTMYRANVRRAKRHPNAIQADRVEQALAYYRVAALREPGAAVETVLADFLTDLRHYCERMRQDLAALERVAQLNYLNEIHRR
ncbi:MAG: hypothetical protein JSS38_16365 [Nitrospira sp.]|nr:hypothetical protein [Nitrospira sp.]